MMLTFWLAILGVWALVMIGIAVSAWRKPPPSKYIGRGQDSAGIDSSGG